MAYVSVDELAAFIEIKTDSRHPELERAIVTAQAEVDSYCGWGPGAFEGDTVATARTFPASSLYRQPLHGSGFWTTDGLVVATDDDADGTYEITWAASDYFLEPSGNRYDGVHGFPFHEIRAVDRYRFPMDRFRPELVQVTAKWGWQTLPSAVTEATMLRAAQLHHRSRTADGIQPLTGFRAGGRDRDWQLLLDPYRHPDQRRWCG